MSSNSDPITIPHQPGKLDFQIVEKEVSVTQFRRKPSAVWAYLETAGHDIVFTRRGKRDCAIMSIETHACMSGDYERTMREVEGGCHEMAGGAKNAPSTSKGGETA